MWSPHCPHCGQTCWARIAPAALEPKTLRVEVHPKTNVYKRGFVITWISICWNAWPQNILASITLLCARYYLLLGNPDSRAQWSERGCASIDTYRFKAINPVNPPSRLRSFQRELCKRNSHKLPVGLNRPVPNIINEINGCHMMSIIIRTVTILCSNSKVSPSISAHFIMMSQSMQLRAPYSKQCPVSYDLWCLWKSHG